MDTGAGNEYQEVSFKVPLLHREKELRFMVGQTVGEQDECVKVKEAFDDAGNQYHLKLVLRDEMEQLKNKAALMRKLNTDMCIMKLLDSKHILKMYQVFVSDAIVYVLLEHTTTTLAGLLTSHPNGLPPLLAKSCFKHLCCSVEYLHDRALCHRNITPNAVKFGESDEMVKLGDFGCACLQMTKEVLYDHPNVDDRYASPELRGDGNYNGKQSDVWSLGCILYEMLTGRQYVEGSPLGDELGDAADVLRGMLVVDPAERATLQDVMGSGWLMVEGRGLEKSELLARHGSIEDLEAFTDSELKANFKRIGTGLGLDVLCDDTLDDTLMDGSFSPLSAHGQKSFTLIDTPATAGLSPDWSGAHQPPSFELSPSGTATCRLKSRLTVDVFTNATQTDTTLNFSPMHRTRD